jgi:hypothetical protein
MTKPSKRHLRHNNIALNLYGIKRVHLRLGLKPFQTQADIRAAARDAARAAIRAAAHAAIRPVNRPVLPSEVISKPYPTFHMTRKKQKRMYRLYNKVLTDLKQGLKSQIKYVDTTSDDPTTPSWSFQQTILQCVRNLKYKYI